MKDLGKLLKEVKKHVKTLPSLTKLVYVSSVYDGDTFTGIELDFSKEHKEIGIKYDLKYRLSGINCPEIRSRAGYVVSPEEKERAKIARDYVRELILGTYVTCDYLGKDKYGRILCNAYAFHPKTIQDVLVEKGMAIYKQY